METKETQQDAPIPEWAIKELAEIGVFLDHEGEPFNKNANELAAKLGRAEAALTQARDALRDVKQGVITREWSIAKVATIIDAALAATQTKEGK